MAAPFFCTQTSLMPDLNTLGYPDTDLADSFLSDGQSRVALLSWLAEQIDPLADVSTVPTLASFWDRMGVHTSVTPNATGHYIPLTAPNRPPYRAASLVFLRAAIDLVLAIRRVRNGEQTAPWLKKQGEESDVDEDGDEFDATALNQIDQLINSRHQLFPLAQMSTASKPKLKRSPLLHRSTTSPNIVASLNGPAKPKPRPKPSQNHNHNHPKSKPPKAGLSTSLTTSSTAPAFKKKAMTMSIAKSVSSRREPGVSAKGANKSPSLSTREAVLERLRTMRHDASTFETKIAAEDNRAERRQQVFTKGSVDSDVNDYDAFGDDKCQLAVDLASEADRMTSLAQQLDRVMDDAQAIRGVKGERAKRDVHMEISITKMTPQLHLLSKSMIDIMTSACRARAAGQLIDYHGKAFHSLPESIGSVVGQQRRAENHL